MNSGEEEEEVPPEKLAQNGRSFQPEKKNPRLDGGLKTHTHRGIQPAAED